jgi:hypothetical protein
MGDTDEFKEWIKQSTEKEAESLSIKPYERPSRDIDILIREYFLSRKYAQQAPLKASPSALKVVQTTISRHTSLVSSSNHQLEPILLKDMFVNKVHFGKALTVQMANTPFLSDGVLYCLVTDSGGEQLEHMCLYNFGCGFKEAEVCEYFERGTRLVVKEPYLKLAANGSRQFFLRVDSPSDLIALASESSPR